MLQVKSLARLAQIPLFDQSPSSSSELGRWSWTQKSQRVGAGFSLVRRDRDSNSGTKKIGHSLAGCCITTLPPLQVSRMTGALLRLWGGKNSEILPCTTTHAKGVCILPLQMSTRTFQRIQKLNNTMKKLLFLGAFALFAFAASAQSTQAPSDKKAKTEQTCSKDAQKTSCTKGEKATCDKSKSAGCCSKGASASTDAKGAACSKSSSAGCCSKSGSASATTDDKKKKKSKKGSGKSTGLTKGN